MNLQLWKQRKKKLQLKYKDISKLSGVPLTTVKSIFLGYVTYPRIQNVEAIERALGLDRCDETAVEMPNETPTNTDAPAFEIVIKIIIGGAKNDG